MIKSAYKIETFLILITVWSGTKCKKSRIEFKRFQQQSG